MPLLLFPGQSRPPGQSQRSGIHSRRQERTDLILIRTNLLLLAIGQYQEEVLTPADLQCEACGREDWNSLCSNSSFSLPRLFLQQYNTLMHLAPILIGSI
jgi:hypothetical protein